MSSKVNNNRMTTFIPKVEDGDDKKWWIVDLEGKILGRTATQLATILRGKDKPTFTPHMDMGDHIVVINCEKVKVTGRKIDEIKYYRYSGYPGGLHVTDYEKMMLKHPERIIEHAVKGMLPKTKLGRKMIKKLHIYAGPDHPHAAQDPTKLEV